MPLNPGNDTVIFIHQEWNGPPDRYGVTGPVSTNVTVRGCALQPMSGKEHLSETMFTESTDRCVAPANSTTLAAVPGDFIQYGDKLMKYRILDIRPFRDGWGRTDHITFICKFEEG